MKYFYLYFLLLIGTSISLNAQQELIKDIVTTGGEATGAGGSASFSIGQTLVPLTKNCGGSAQNGVQQPDYPILNLVSSFNATDTSDAYITLSWSLLEECFKDIFNSCSLYPDGVLIEVLAEGERIYSDIVYDANGDFSDSYRHFVGPDSTVDYTLNVFIRGNGSEACNSIPTTGSTISYQPPTDLMASQGTFPDKVELSWTNNSQLTSTILIFRESEGVQTLITSLPGAETVDTTIKFVDEFSLGDSLSLSDGQMYTYCLRTYNQQLDEVQPGEECTDGSTLDVNFAASLLGMDQVDLSWADISAFAETLNIRRDEILIATVENGTISYIDEDPTFGQSTTYQLDVLDVEGNLLLRSEASVTTPAIGELSGFVRTPIQVGIPSIEVQYTAIISGDTLQEIAITDYRGFYQFDEVFYGRGAEFTIKALNQGQFTFSNSGETVFLDNTNPILEDINIYANEDYPLSIGSSLSIDTIITVAGIDELNFNWVHAQTGPIDAPLHFQLFREGQLIDITDDTQPLPLALSDRSGNAGFIYKYSVVGYGFKGDSLVLGSRVIRDTMPVVATPFDFVGVEDFDALSENMITLVWNHNSDNFDGFRLYRDMELIAVLEPGENSFYDYFAAPGESFNYMLTTFRIADDGATIESEPAILNAVNIPSLPALVNLNAVPTPDNSVDLSWSLSATANAYDNVSGFIIYREGEAVLRSIKQGEDYLMREYCGSNGAANYSIAPYLYAGDTTYVGDLQNFPAVNFPNASAPLINSSPSPDGYLSITIDPDYAQTNLNYDGYVLFADGIAFDTLMPSEQMTYYTPNIAGGIASVDISIQAFREVDGSYEYGLASQETVSIPTQAATLNLQEPSSFQASEHIPMHVALSWHYPDYIFATFEIFRNGLPIDTLPTETRYYYDTDAVPGDKNIYSIQAMYEGEESPVISDEGQRRGQAYILGQIVTQDYSSGLNKIPIYLREGTSLVRRTFTNESGFFCFDQLPVGTGNFTVSLNAERSDLLLQTSSLNLPGLNKETAIFQDAITIASEPPLPLIDSFATINSFELKPLLDEGGLTASWSLNEGVYEGTTISRGLTVIDPVEVGSPMFLIDSSGVGGIGYSYSTSPYIIDDGRRTSFDTIFNRSLDIDYPLLEPVEYLSALGAVNGLDNSVTLQWSHHTGKLTYYELLRNGLPLYQAPADSNLIFIDTTGKPDQVYTYQLRAVKIVDGNITISDPRSISITYPEVARPEPFSATPVPDSNAVYLTWSYNGTALNGFRVFRNGEVIANLSETDTAYYDFLGFPMADTEYRIVAIMERGGMQFQSRASVAATVFPEISAPYDLMLNIDNELGLVSGNFMYAAGGVNRFKIYRTIPQLSIFEEIASISYTYDGTAQTFDFEDRGGTPGLEYEYQVVAESDRFGFTFESTPEIGIINEYPYPPVLLNLTATDNKENWVDLEWSLPLDANVDGFMIYRMDGPGVGAPNVPNPTYSIDDYLNIQNLELVESLDLPIPGKRSYQDVFTSIIDAPIGEFNYVVAGYREVNGETFSASLRADNGSLGISAPVLWAGGNSASVWGWNGIEWIAYSNGLDPSYQVTDFWGTAPDDAWAIAGENNNGEGAIIRWDGSNWNTLDDTNIEYGQDIWGVSTERIWVADNTGVVRWNGIEWVRELNTGGARVFALWGVDENNIWAAGSGSIFKYNSGDGSWDEEFSTAQSEWFRGMWGTDSDNIWAVSQDNSGTDIARIYKWDGVEWRKQYPDLNNQAYNGVWNGSNNRAWAVGSNGTVAKWDENGRVLQLSGTTGSLWGIWGENESSIWAVGDNGTILRYNGQTWSESGPVPNNNRLLGIETSVSQTVNYVSASKGAFANRTRVEWQYFGDPNQFEGFNLYRDDELIATLNTNIFFYNDSDGIPGKPYVYTVKVYTEDNEFLGKADIGYAQGNGQIEGEVSTAVGNVPIEGALLVAVADIGGERYTYETTTNNSGQYILEGMYIGEEAVSYNLTVSYLDHGFLPSERVVNLSPQNSTRTGVFFIDTTSYTVAGRITYQGGCTIDSITVEAKQYLSSGEIVVESTQTDAEGYYSLVVRPDLPGLEKIIIEANPVFIRNQGIMDTEANILHQFSTSAYTIDLDVLEAERALTFNFVDTLAYGVKISIENICGFAASSNGLFDVEIATTDGCFLKTVQTNVTGKVSTRLPPLNGYTARVVSASPLSLENNLIIDYLEYRPIMMDLEAIHINNIEYDENGELVLIDKNTKLEETLVYHKPAMINLANEFGTRPSCDPEQPRFINQNEAYSIQFDVTEEHQGEVCNVTGGYLIINNSAASPPTNEGEEDKTNDRLDYVESEGRFEIHTFEGGKPNLVFPYRKGINIQYFSSSGDLIAERTIPVVVLGTNEVPGNDVIVDVTDSDGQVKLPLYILRDPPGDGSSSSIEEGQTFNKSISRTFGGGATGGYEANYSANFFSAGVYGNYKLQAGQTNQRQNSYEISTSTNQKISTSSTSDFVGTDADVLVGVGASIQYGIIEELLFDEATCEFQSIRKLGVAVDEIKTDWLYTVGQIKQLVNEFRAQVDSVENGSLQISRGAEVLSQSSAEAFLETKAENWESILHYHAIESVPFFQLCVTEFNEDKLWKEALFYNKGEEYKRGIGVFDEDIELDPSSTPEEYKIRVSQAEDARVNFCNAAGLTALAADSENLGLEALNAIFFNNDLAEQYEIASRKVEYWLDSLYIPAYEVESRLETEEVNSFFPRVENTTFSAGVTIYKSSTVTRNTSTKFSQKVFTTIDFASGTNLKLDTDASVFIVEKNLADVEGRAGFVGSLNFEFGSERYKSSSSTITTSYTLSDDDPGDQFSVTAIRGRTQGHTPYFQLLGGRSSCPPEYVGVEETGGPIQRDRPILALYDPETSATFDVEVQNDLDPNQQAIFYLQITNASLFGEQRDIFVYHDAASNENGAVVRLNGSILGGGNQSGQTLTFLNPNQPVILSLTLTRSINNYQFENINIIVRPSCTDGDLYLLGRDRDTVTISAFFEHPCSDVTISSPGDNWLITRRNPLVDNSREAIVIKLTDYEAENSLLQEVYLEYRRLGDGSPWYKIPNTRLGPPAPQNQTDPELPVSNEFLIQFNEENFGDFGVPVLPITWDITELYDEFPDGEYEIRAVSSCGEDGVVFSNIITGEIRRQTDDLFFVTEPRDGIWEPGDAISVKINKELGCAPDTSKFEVVSLTTGAILPGGISCSPTDNTLEFFPDEANLLSFDGQLLEATVYDLNDGANLYPDTIRWQFRVISRDFYAQDTCLETTIYQDRQSFLSTTIFNNTSSPLLDYVASYADVYPWLMTEPSPGMNTAIPEIVGKRITFTIDGANLPVGDTTAVVYLMPGNNSENGGQDSIKIKVKVLARPPYWEVDPSQYTSSMTVIANYEYLDAPNMISNDTMDLISAWIDNEIRGVSPILNTDAGLSAALIEINGDPEDVGRPIEFRVWDADPGMEYNAYPLDTIHFELMDIKGNFTNPEILFIDKEKDKARYIPVNGDAGPRGGLTWLSFNSIETDRSVNAHLRELVFAQNGDVIKTGDNRSAGYIEGVGWYSSNGLDTLRPEEGYILYLGGVDDTIRVTGYDAPVKLINLNGTWNLIGYPLQDTLNINTALAGLQPQNAANFIRSEAQDPSLPGLSTNMATTYENGTWVEVPNGMEVLRPNFAYQIRTLQPAILNYPANTPFAGSPIIVDDSFGAPVQFNPADVETWQVDPSEYPSSMVIMAAAHFNGHISNDPNDMVAAFVNGECRGVSPLYYIEALDQHTATLFVYGETPGEEVQILLYDASEDEVYLNDESFVYAPNDLIGNFSNPYPFNNQIRAAAFFIENTYCEVDEVGTVEVAMVTGLEAPYVYEWSNGDTTSSVQNLIAGDYTVTITGQLGLDVIDTVTIVNQQIEIPVPELESSLDNPVCVGSDVVLYALPPNSASSIVWYDEEGNWLQNGEALLVEGVETTYHTSARTDYNGCLSELQEATIEVYQPVADYLVIPEQDITTETMVEFVPETSSESYTYQWSFGDGSQSDAMQPTHQYNLPGLYTTNLNLIDDQGCASETSTYNVWVDAATHMLEIHGRTMSLEVMPNPFSYELRALVEIPEAGQYKLVLRNMQGQLIRQYPFEWEQGTQLASLEVEAQDGVYLLSLEHPEGDRIVIPIVKQAIRP